MNMRQLHIFLLNQNLTWDCLMISCFPPFFLEFTWAKPEIVTILGLAQVNLRENVEINKQYMSSFGWIELSFDLNLIYSRKLIGNDLSVPLCHFCIKKRSIRRWSDKRLSVIGTGQRLRNYLLFTTNKTFVSRPRPALELKTGP